MMERLYLSDKSQSYNATEAAIHIARYQMAVSHCAGRRVLDVACGEGYGSYYLLHHGGANSVDGVDVAPEAIEAAENLFNQDRLQFYAHDACDLENLFDENTFDVIVSIETIEHLDDPERFLNSIKHVGKEDCKIFITCPNDHWYYPDKDQQNPYHVRKYNFAEFQKLTTSILGDNVCWGLGVVVLGFGVIPTDTREANGRSNIDPSQITQIAMMDVVDQASAVFVSPEPETRPEISNCSFFVGMWGGQTPISVSAVHPASMDVYSRICAWRMQGQYLPDDHINMLHDKINMLHDKITSLEHEHAAAKAEVERSKEFLRSPIGLSRAALRALAAKVYGHLP